MQHIVLENGGHEYASPGVIWDCEYEDDSTICFCLFSGHLFNQPSKFKCFCMLQFTVLCMTEVGKITDHGE